MGYSLDISWLYLQAYECRLFIPNSSNIASQGSENYLQFVMGHTFGYGDGNH